MVISMTGFGRSTSQSDQFSVTVEIKSVNHRFSEYNIRMPRHLSKIEDKIKKKIGEHVFRGRAEVFITIDGEGILNRKVNIDWPLLDEYFQYITKIQEKYSINEAISLQDIMNREEFISIVEEESGNDELEALVLDAVAQAALQLKQMRSLEGESLQKDIKTHLNQLSGRITVTKELAPLVVHQYEERLKKRMLEYADGQIEEARIVTEVAIFADKADINEELTRLESHITQFEQTLLLSEPVGRKLDFLLQEMNREVNTIGSKANDSSIAKEVVEMKSLLEKMKEQVQNIE